MNIVIIISAFFGIAFVIAMVAVECLSEGPTYRIVKAPIKGKDYPMFVPEKRTLGGLRWKSLLKNNEILTIDEAKQCIWKDKEKEKRVVYKED